MWLVYAVASAAFAALTAILAKVGLEGVNSHLATAVRTGVVLILAWGMVFWVGAFGTLAELSRKSWLFLVLSGLATGASWLCYYKALQMGEVSKVAAIDKLSVVLTIFFAVLFLGESLSLKTLIATALLASGILLLAL